MEKNKIKELEKKLNIFNVIGICKEINQKKEKINRLVNYDRELSVRTIKTWTVVKAYLFNKPLFYKFLEGREYILI